MNNWEKEDKRVSDAWIKAYKEISKLTGIKLEDTVNHSYCVVKLERVCGKESLYGKVGVYEHNERDIDYFRFKGHRKLVGFRQDEVYHARNVILLLEEKKKLSLF